MKKTVFIKNAAILTVSSLLLRFIGIIFKVWLAKEIGAEGMGLYQLVFSVYILASTFATSGICTAVTRLTADELALGSKKTVKKILTKCISVTLFIAVLSTVILFFGAKFISLKILSDKRACGAIKILSFSLPFMGISSCFKGYFIAKRKASPNALSQIFEQIVRISIVMWAIKKYAQRGIAVSCCAVLFGDTAAEFFSAAFLALIYYKDSKKLELLSGRTSLPFNVFSAIKHIALPITAGRYLNTALRTAENILVPKNLAKYPHSGNNALSQFGMIKGMALPILFFPSTLLNSISTLLIPEMSEAAAKGRRLIVKNAVEQVIKLTSIISFIFACVFFYAGRKIGYFIYKSDDVGFLLEALSPIIPFMYLDSVSDGILKGLDQQAFTFRTSIMDSLLRIILVLIALPFFGIKGFIGIMYISNFLTCALNVGRLIKISKAEFNILKDILLPLSVAAAITSTVNLFLKTMPLLPDLVYIILICLFSVCLYAAFLLSTDSLKQSRQIRTRLKRRNLGAFRLVIIRRRQPCEFFRTKNHSKFRTF